VNIDTVKVDGVNVGTVDADTAQTAVWTDTVRVRDKGEYAERIDTANYEVHLLSADSIVLPSQVKIDPDRWIPNPKKAMWLAIAFPGAGQIYNRKYWKLPLIYGGFVGCIYALSWNGSMYRDYSQAYMDIMDQNPETQSYNQFLHLGRTIDDSNRSAYENKFKRRKDYYRRYRDLSAFILIGVYAISVIDAYVDASLSEFDISDDLSLKVSPAIMNGAQQGRNPLSSAAVGLQCSLNF
jgi:hypothetical protein